MVERDGTLIMVDDDRMPLRDGEVPTMKTVRFRTLGCYPLTGAIESTADTLPAIIQEMLLARTSERAGPRHRPRLGRLDGEEEAGGVLLMAHVSDLIAARHRRATCRRTTGKGAAALHHLRQRRRRQEHAHRAPALRVEDALRRPARGARPANPAKFGTQGDDLDFALLVDGLSAEREQGITIDVAYRLLLDRAAQVHRRRHARARAVHPQHGDRRLDRRRRRAARSTRARACSPRPAATATSCR